MPTPITRFKCNHCKRHYSINSDARKHENRCLYNPENKSCGSCLASISSISGWCNKLEREIFVSGKPVRDCPEWKEIEFAEDECSEDI